MRRNSVTLLIDMARTAMGTVSCIRQAAYTLEDDGDVTELIADSLNEAHTALEVIEEELREYRIERARGVTTWQRVHWQHRL